MFNLDIRHTKFSNHIVIIDTKMELNILVAEDYIDLAESYKTALQVRGHFVTITRDGIECLQAYKDHIKLENMKGSSYFDIVILDQQMPRMDGIDVAKEIQQLNPQQRIIFITGYDNNIMKNLRQINENVEIMNKPFTLQALINQVEGMVSPPVARTD